MKNVAKTGKNVPFGELPLRSTLRKWQKLCMTELFYFQSSKEIPH